MISRKHLQKVKQSDSETQSLIEIDDPIMNLNNNIQKRAGNNHPSPAYSNINTNNKSENNHNNKDINQKMQPMGTDSRSQTHSQTASYSWLITNTDRTAGDATSSTASGSISRTSTVESSGGADGKYPLASVFGITVLTLGTFLYGGLGTVAKLSFLGEEDAAYNKSSVLIIAELTKLVASIGLLIRELQFDLSAFFRTVFINQSWKNWVIFAVPATIYSVTNVLDFYLVKLMDPGTMQVLLQSKTLTTAIVWWIWFRKPINKQQWLALLLLSVGCACAANLKSKDSSKTEQGSYIIFPMGPILILTQTLLSALAGVYTEAVYKNGDTQYQSIHLANLGMYMWGTIANVVQFYFHSRTPKDSLLNLTHDFNVFTWMMVGIFASMGLIIAQVMKYFSNIIKLFMLGASVICAGCLSYLVIGVPWNALFVVGMLLVIFSIYLFKTETVWINC